MLIPQFSLQQSEDCQSVYFKDTTCWYDVITCNCGYSPNIPSANFVNPTKNEISKTVITITDPAGSVFVVNKGYLPIQPSSQQITCADLALSTTTTVISENSDCGCGSVQTVTTTTIPASCFADGCWTFKYDVYATQTLVTYTWNLNGSPAFVYPGYCTSIIINSSTYTSSNVINDESELLTWLNTLDSGYFTITSNVLSVSSSTNIYDTITMKDSRPYFSVTWTGCTVTFPVSLTSVTINGTLHSIGISVASWDEVIATINNLGVGTYSNGGQISGTEFIFQESCGVSVINDFVFANACDFHVEMISPSTTTLENDTSSVDSEIIVGTSSHQEFLHCNIKNAIKQFKLTNLQRDCACGDTMSICELDSDYSTLLVAISAGGTCSCACATAYLTKAQNDLSVLQKLCQ